MKWLKITNYTEIEPNAFKLLGACTKRDNENQIGYFGTGLKYAIAVLLREGIAFQIFANGRPVVITTTREKFRGQVFDVIVIDGEKTSLTTSMGVEWKVWHAIREIVCNAIDEGTHEVKQVDDSEPEPGATNFYIAADHPLVAEVLRHWDSFFAFDRKSVVPSTYTKMYTAAGSTVNLYRKGVRCYDSSFCSLYDYDFDNIGINEARVVQHSHYIHEKIAAVWAEHATPAMIQQLLDIDDKHIEWHSSWDFRHFGEQWGKFFDGKILVPKAYAGWFVDLLTQNRNAIMVEDSLVRGLKRSLGDRIVTAKDQRTYNEKFCQVTPDKKQSFLLKEALNFFDEVKLDIPYDIIVATFNDSKIAGMAHGKQIVISTKAFDKGKRYVVSTILEEFAHIESEAPDESRGFQNYLIEQIISLLETRHGIFL